jgi:hypothetical protein
VRAHTGERDSQPMSNDERAQILGSQPVAAMAKEPSRDEKISVTFGPCCFCARDIEEVGTDPCTIIVETATGKGQVWKCHASCFREKLSDPPESPGLFEPFHF